jgi:hypothetical protein
LPSEAHPANRRDIAQTICAPAPHRQLVFTIPKRLRIFCRHDCSLLGKLARAAWQTTVEVYRQALGRRDVIPGMVAGIYSASGIPLR